MEQSTEGNSQTVRMWLQSPSAQILEGVSAGLMNDDCRFTISLGEAVADFDSDMMTGNGTAFEVARSQSGELECS